MTTAFVKAKKISFAYVHIEMSVGDGFLKTFLEKTKAMSPEERARYLEEDEVSIECQF